jgi:lipid A 3-O-deacylase
LCCLAFSAAAAGTGCPAGGVYSFYLENDLFYRSDRNYTSGIKLTYVSPDIKTFYDHADCVPAAAQAVDATLRDLFSGVLKSAADQRNIVTTLGQEIYTPGDLRRRDVIREDRPYAAWLYLGLAYNERRVAELDSLEVRLGMVGPLAFGRQAQDFIHELRSFDKFQGWGNQLRNEPGAQLIAERRFRSFRDDAGSKDVTFHYGGSIGNVATYVNAGMETRIGAGLPDDFGSSPTRPAGNNTAPGSYRSTTKQLAAHLFAALDARLVVRDIFLDGNSFVHSYRVHKRPFVADLSLGAAVFIYGLKVSYARVLRSQEFKGQPSRHSFGSVTLSYAFD